MQWAKKQPGFTIVELLIVIVVIAILAAVTIVGYNGISQRAKQSAAQSAVSQATKKILAYAVENAEQYPAQLTDAGITNSDSTSYQYSVNNSVSPRTYCLTATYQNVSYYQNSSTQQSPASGACPGHGVNGLPPNLAQNGSFEDPSGPVTVRTNLLSNPTFETSSTGWSTVNGGVGASVAQSGARAHTGANSLLYTYGDSIIQDSGPGSSISATAGTTYTISAWVYANSSIGGGLRLIAYGSALTSTVRGTMTTATTGAWVRLTQTVTATATGTLSFAVGKVNSIADTGELLYVDSVLIQPIPVATEYFAGNTAASLDYTYIWAGAAHGSLSYERATNINTFNLNGSGAMRYQSSVRATSGTYSGRVTVVSSPANPGLYQNISLEAGTYTFISKVWIDAGVNSTVSLTVQGTGVSLSPLAGYLGATTTEGQWVELRRAFTIPAAASVNAFTYIPGSSVAIGANFWVDDFAIVAGMCTDAVCY